MTYHFFCGLRATRGLKRLRIAFHLSVHQATGYRVDVPEDRCNSEWSAWLDIHITPTCLMHVSRYAQPLNFLCSSAQGQEFFEALVASASVFPFSSVARISFLRPSHSRRFPSLLTLRSRDRGAVSGVTFGHGYILDGRLS